MSEKKGETPRTEQLIRRSIEVAGLVTSCMDRDNAHVVTQLLAEMRSHIESLHASELAQARALPEGWHEKPVATTAIHHPGTAEAGFGFTLNDWNNLAALPPNTKLFIHPAAPTKPGVDV